MKNENSSLVGRVKNTADHAAKKVTSLAARAKTKLDDRAREKELARLFAALGELTFEELQNEPHNDQRRAELIADIAAKKANGTRSS